ncbi:MAG: hypothetical protein CVV05_12435 [Gammaproteobacteria bacterium HGW-Gammaproteobacteria-1]|jgi:hypothetical protein|nr:MAG: hypothetical protein CVV05_12435 [Gammaproteobacteria bacterium HGW-Gammaproteobacteria-1]
MAKVMCKYHPQRAARWACEHCRINFCSSCLSKENPDGPPACPLCRNPAVEVENDGMVPPFWNRLPRFFIMPFQAQPLVMLVVMVVLSALVGYRSISSLLVQLVLLLVYYKYVYAMLAHRARGHEEAPPVMQALSGEGLGLAFKQFAVFVILFFPLGIIGNLAGPTAAMAYYIVAMLCLPASIMALAVEGNVGAAVNPSILFGIISRIGAPYLALFFLLGVLSSGPNVVLELLTDRLGADFIALQEMGEDEIDPAEATRITEAFMDKLFGIIIPVAVLLNGYFTMVMFNLMGYVLFQYHHRLGLEVDVDVEGLAAPDAAAAREHPLLGDVEALIQEGRLEQAVTMLRARVLQNRGDRVLRDRFHRLLALTGDVKRLTGHGAEYIGMLLQGSDRAKAVQVWRDCRQADPDFKLDSPDQVYPLAQTMFSVGEYKSVVALGNGFHKRYPGHADIPRLYLLVARALSEGLNQEQKALPILQLLAQTYAEHPVAPEVKQYLATVTTLTARP